MGALTRVAGLTVWALNKMAAISQKTFSNAFSLRNIFVFAFLFNWNLLPGVSIDNRSALVQVMAWRRRGDKPLPETMMHIHITRLQWVKLLYGTVSSCSVMVNKKLLQSFLPQSTSLIEFTDMLEIHVSHAVLDCFNTTKHGDTWTYLFTWWHGNLFLHYGLFVRGIQPVLLQVDINAEIVLFVCC